MENILWYEKAAEQWEQALPLGNGRLGAMVTGGVQEDCIFLNDDTLYGGKPQMRCNPNAYETLGKVRELLREGKLEEARMLAQAGMTGTPRYLGPYLPLCNLYLRFAGHLQAEDYRRELDLSTAAARTTFVSRGITYTREYITSAPAGVLGIRLTASEKGALDFYVNLMRRPFDPGTVVLTNGRLLMKGMAEGGSTEFDCMVEVRAEGGKVERFADCLHIRGADAAVIYVAADTSFRTDFPEAGAARLLDACPDYDTFRKAHIADYAPIYDRVCLELGCESDPLPTDRRMALLKEGRDDEGLLALMFNMGRYLLIASSRPGTICTNLQGIWNAQFTPSWESVFTININTEMNYWPTGPCNLNEMALPLFDLIRRIYDSGKVTAQAMYHCGGFMAHHNVTPWGNTAPTGAGVYLWPFGAAWLSLQIREHYAFTLDKALLKENYPLLRDAAQFFLDYLIEDENGYLITGLTQSPENSYILPNGESDSIARTCTMDNAILRALFTSVLDAAKVLGEENEFTENVAKALAKIAPYRIGSKGQLLEWDKEYEEIEPGHRHMSHLFGLYPGNDITPDMTPELAAACKRTMDLRLSKGGGHTGWSRAWLINLCARLADGEAAHDHARKLLTLSAYENLFDRHPPFQIDGNFGYTSGLAEMLLQSHQGFLDILPALPKAWESGSVRGLLARGGYEVGISWENGSPVSVTVTAKADGTLKLRSRASLTCDGAEKDGELLVRKMKAGETVTFSAAV